MSFLNGIKIGGIVAKQIANQKKATTAQPVATTQVLTPTETDPNQAFQNNLFKDWKPLMGGNGPQRHRFEGIRQTEGPNKGLLKDQFNLQMDMAPMNQLREQTLNDAASPYVQMQMAGQDLKNQTAIQEARKAAPNPLLARGGNAELAAMKGLNPATAVNPLLNANQANLNVAIQGRQQQMDRLRALPGMEAQALKPQEFNITNALREKEAEDISRFQGWSEDMKAWAATQQAKATAKAGSSGKK